MTVAQGEIEFDGRTPVATLDEIRRWPATVGVPQASEQALGLSRSWGYALVAAGEFPARTIKIRGRTRVVTASLIRLLEGGEP